MADYSLNSNFTPNTPITPFTEVDFLIAANTNLTNLQSQSASQKPFGANVAPSVKKNFQIKEKLLRPALTSHYQCWFNPPTPVINWIKTYKNLIIFSIKN